MSDLMDSAGDRALLPPELAADPNNPANDGYYDSLRSARAAVTALQANMRPKHARIAALTHAGVSVSEVAKELKVSVSTVYRHLTGDTPVTRLLAALRHTAALYEGPSLALRKNVLWRITTRSEEIEPQVAIAALKELNKLDGAYPAPAPPTSPNVNITINAEQLPRTALDAPVIQGTFAKDD